MADSEKYIDINKIAELKGLKSNRSTPEMIIQFEKFLFHPSRFKVGKAISLAKFSLERKGIENLSSDIAFRRYADHLKKIRYDKWILFREGEKAFNDKVEPYIERDISKLDVGDVLVADGHDLNFQVINPFTGKPTRATFVGFFDWKSSTLLDLSKIFFYTLKGEFICVASKVEKVHPILLLLKYTVGSPSLCPKSMYCSRKSCTLI